MTPKRQIRTADDSSTPSTVLYSKMTFSATAAIVLRPPFFSAADSRRLRALRICARAASLFLADDRSSSSSRSMRFAYFSKMSSWFALLR